MITAKIVMVQILLLYFLLLFLWILNMVSSFVIYSPTISGNWPSGAIFSPFVSLKWKVRFQREKNVSSHFLQCEINGQNVVLRHKTLKLHYLKCFGTISATNNWETVIFDVQFWKMFKEWFSSRRKVFVVQGVAGKRKDMIKEWRGCMHPLDY